MVGAIAGVAGGDQGVVSTHFLGHIKTKLEVFDGILTLCFRGLTDHMFGGNRMTAIVIAMVLLPDFVGLGKKTGGQVGKILRRVYTKEVDTLEKEDVPDEKTVTSNGLSKQEPGVALVTRPATNAMTKLRDRNI